MVTEQRVGPGEGVVGDAVPLHASGVHHRASRVGHQQLHHVPDHCLVAHEQCTLEDALQDQQPVAVMGKPCQHVRREGAEHLGDLVGTSCAHPLHSRLGPDRDDAEVDAVPLERGRLGGAPGRVAGEEGSVAAHLVEHCVRIRDHRDPCRCLGALHQLCGEIVAVTQQLERKPTGCREELRAGRLLGQLLDRSHGAVHPGQVQDLPGHGQHPQLGLQPRVRVGEVSGGVIEPDRPLSALRHLVGPPVRRQRSVERVGLKDRVVLTVRQVQSLYRERAGAVRFTRVGPAPRERRGEPCPQRRGVGRLVGRVQPDGQAARGQVVLLTAGQTQHRRGAHGEVALALADLVGLVEQGHGGLAVATGPGILGPGQQRGCGRRLVGHRLEATVRAAAAAPGQHGDAGCPRPNHQCTRRPAR